MKGEYDRAEGKEPCLTTSASSVRDFLHPADTLIPCSLDAPGTAGLLKKTKG